MFKVINISTTTETYIANEILTHNKKPIPNEINNSYTLYNYPLYVSFDPTYTYKVPYSINVYYIYTGPEECRDFVLIENPYINYGWYTPKIDVQVNRSYYPGYLYPWGASWDLYAEGTDGNNVVALTPTPLTLGASCLTPDTIITKFDNSKISLNDINIGDELKTINLTSMKYEKTIVTSKTSHEVNSLFIINNGLLKASDSHKHIVKRNKEWLVLTSLEIKVGDIILNENFEENIIDKIEIIK